MTILHRYFLSVFVSSFQRSNWTTKPTRPRPISHDQLAAAADDSVADASADSADQEEKEAAEAAAAGAAEGEAEAADGDENDKDEKKDTSTKKKKKKKTVKVTKTKMVTERKKAKLDVVSHFTVSGWSCALHLSLTWLVRSCFVNRLQVVALGESDCVWHEKRAQSVSYLQQSGTGAARSFL